MEEYFTAGDAGWTAQLNAVIQASSRAAYHTGGGQITPGTSSTDISVAVDAGTGVVAGTNISWAAEELILDDGGVGPSGTDQQEPRVDAIYAREDSTLGVATGEPEPFTPDQLPDGSAYTPQPMEHWTPAPDSGSRIGGLVLGFVLVNAGATTAADIPAENIQQWTIGTALDSSRLVFGDGSANGPTTIAVDNDPVSIEDSNRSSPEIVDYDADNDLLSLGGPNVRVEAQSVGTLTVDENVGVVFDAEPDQNDVVNLWETEGPGTDRFAGQLGLGAPVPTPYSIRNLTTQTNLFSVFMGGGVSIHGGTLEDVNNLDFVAPTGTARVHPRDGDGHLIYEAPGGQSIDLTAGEGDLS